jgi:glycosyltransferase involved in cell wall biosynthesis
MQTKEKFNVSVILPLKSVAVIDFEDYFKKSIQSLKDQKYPINELIIVHTDETKTIEFLDSYDFGELNVVKLIWTKKPSFAEQINYGVNSAKSEWVSILEFDDEYSKIWFDNVRKYSEIFVDTDVFLPIVVDTDEKGMFAGFTNEATFALNISQEMGILSYETLQNFQNFQISGMAIKKSSFLNYGMIKPSFKLTFGYEFFLRMTYNSLKIMTIPKIGYKHTNMRTGSIFWDYKNGDDRLTQEEVKFWIDTAKKESFFTNERDIKYVI